MYYEVVEWLAFKNALPVITWSVPPVLTLRQQHMAHMAMRLCPLISWMGRHAPPRAHAGHTGVLGSCSPAREGACCTWACAACCGDSPRPQLVSCPCSISIATQGTSQSSVLAFCLTNCVLVKFVVHCWPSSSLILCVGKSWCTAGIDWAGAVGGGAFKGHKDS